MEASAPSATWRSFSLSHDGKQLVYAVSAHDTSKNGVFAVNLTGGEPATLLAGKGEYQKITWDENPKQLVFLSDRDDKRRNRRSSSSTGGIVRRPPQQNWRRLRRRDSARSL